MYILRKIRLGNLPPFYVNKITLNVPQTDVCQRPQEQPLQQNYTQPNYKKPSGVKLKPKAHKQHVLSLTHSTEKYNLHNTDTIPSKRVMTE